MRGSPPWLARIADSLRGRRRRRLLAEMQALEACLEAGGWASYRIAPDGAIAWSRNAAEVLAAGGQPLPEGLNGWLACIDAQDRDRLRRHYEALRAGRASSAQEFILRHAAGAEAACEDIARPFATGRAWEVVGLVRNLTAARALQEELRQARPAASVGRIAATIAHDLANVLTAIHGEGQLLAAAPQASAGRLTAAIMAAAERGRQLCHQILFVARPRALRAEVRAADLIEELRAMLGGLARPGVEIRTEVEPGELAVRCNAGRLLQALLNLCINALEAMKGGGVLTIRCFHVRNETPFPGALGIVHVGRFVCFELSDTGEGIPQQLLGRIFEPGYSTKQGDAPRGLGLSIIASVLHEIGAFLDVDSRTGADGRGAPAGTTFRIYVPGGAAGPAAATVLRAAGLGRGESVLVIDLDEDSLLRLEDMVASLGYEPNAFSSCDEALRSARSRGAYQAALVAGNAALADGTPFYEAIAPYIPPDKIILISRSSRSVPAARMPVLVEPFSHSDLGAVLARIAAH